MSRRRDNYKKQRVSIKKQRVSINQQVEEPETSEEQSEPFKLSVWMVLFGLLAVLLLAFWIFANDYRPVLFKCWAVAAGITILIYLHKYLNGSIKFDTSSAAKFIIFVMCLKIAFSPNDSIRQPDVVKYVRVGHFLKKENHSFFYQLSNSSKIWEIPVSDSIYFNETEEFVKAREYAILEEEPFAIKSFDADEELFKSNCAYFLHTHYASEKLLSNSYFFASQYPTDYYKQFGLNVVYRAKVVGKSGNNTINVEYNDEYQQTKQTAINNKDQLEIDDNILISRNIDIERDNEFQIVVNPEKYVNYAYMGYLGFIFSDTIVSYKTLFEEVPQLKKLLLKTHKTDLYSIGNARVAYYLNTCESSDGEEYPVFFYYNFNGSVDTMMVYIQSQRLGNAILIDYPSKRILKNRLSTEEIKKYKYPINFDANGNEIGNNTYCYAKYSPEIYTQHFSPQKCYLAIIKSIKTINDLYSDVKVLLNTPINKNQIVDCSIPITSDIQVAILVQEGKNYRSVDKRFYTEQYYNKLKDGSGFLFNDTIVTQEELLHSIPSMDSYIHIFE